MTDIPTREAVQQALDRYTEAGIGENPKAFIAPIMAAARVALPHLPTQCDRCNGSGEIPMREDAHDDFVEPCPKCGGTGTLIYPPKKGEAFRWSLTTTEWEAIIERATVVLDIALIVGTLEGQTKESTKTATERMLRSALNQEQPTLGPGLEVTDE